MDYDLRVFIFAIGMGLFFISPWLIIIPLLIFMFVLN